MEHMPLSREAFAPLVGSAFRVTDGSRAVELVLDDVSALRSSPRNVAFSLVFSGPADQPITQGEFHFEPAAGTGFDLFIVPIGVTADGRREYEAIVNRLLD
jgi:hypothetical protein